MKAGETRQQEISHLAHQGADSVYEFIERTAEPTAEGVRWKSYVGVNDARYAVGAYSGAAGISFFLSDYFRTTHVGKARELSNASLEWCSCSARNIQVIDLGAGWSGIGMAWLKYYEATGAATALDRATKIAEKLLEDPPGTAYEHDLSGDVLATDFFRGLAGQGVFLLRLWDITKEDRILEFLEKGVKWLARSATRSDLGCYWPIYIRESGREPPESGMFTGFCHGIAGIGYFLAMLFERSKYENARQLIEEILDTLGRHELKDRHGIAWKRWIEHPDLAPCQWCHGTAGIGLFYAKAFEVLGEIELLDKAKLAAQSTFQHADFRSSPIQCHGLAGNAELFLELHRITEDPRWLACASDFGMRILEYRIPTSEGDVWQGDEPGLHTPDFFCGASGVGHFFLRLANPFTLRMPLG